MDLQIAINHLHGRFDHANAHVRQFHDWRRERFISLLVTKKYFEMTEQLPRTSLW